MRSSPSTFNDTWGYVSLHRLRGFLAELGAFPAWAPRLLGRQPSSLPCDLLVVCCFELSLFVSRSLSLSLSLPPRSPSLPSTHSADLSVIRQARTGEIVWEAAASVASQMF